MRGLGRVASPIFKYWDSLYISGTDKVCENGLLRIAAQCWITHETLKH